MGLITWYKEKRAKSKRAAEKKAALQEYGWDARCTGCGKHYHADNVGKFVCDTISHWHYTCTACNTQVKYLLTIMPVFDGPSTMRVMENPYLIDEAAGFYVSLLTSDNNVYRYSDDAVVATVTNKPTASMTYFNLNLPNGKTITELFTFSQMVPYLTGEKW